MRFGAHISMSGGFEAALDYAESVGLECAQVFAKSPRQWKSPAADPAAGEAFAAERRRRGFGPVFTHTAYLLNLSSTDDELWRKSAEALADELVRAGLMHAEGMVTHIGNNKFDDAEQAARRAAAAIDVAFDLAGEIGARTRLLLENTAGAGASFGGSFSEIGLVMEYATIPEPNLGTCFDTCHGWAYGLEVDSAKGWERALDDLDLHIGIERLGLVHANDCGFERGSKRDRHAWLGDGLIGAEGFSAMVCEPRLAGVCAITEVGGDRPEKDAVNNDRLREWRTRCEASQ